MTYKEKAELVKDSIYQLYVKEGRSKRYIADLLQLSSEVLKVKIAEWGFPEPEPNMHLKPSSRKFLNKNRGFIKSRLDKNTPIKTIASELNVTESFIHNIIKKDETLSQSKQEYLNRLNNQHIDRINNIKEQSSREYVIEDLPGEIWKPVLGYEYYYVSNKGRVKKLSKKYKVFYLRKPTENPENHRLYVNLSCDKKVNNIQVARLVGFNFVDGYSEEKNTINHKDGDVHNNNADNLEWVSQSENNQHSYSVLRRKTSCQKKYLFKKIVYKNKYEFKTVMAFAKFIGKSQTQARRYLDNPEKHDIILVK